MKSASDCLQSKQMNANIWLQIALIFFVKNELKPPAYGTRDGVEDHRKRARDVHRISWSV